MGYMRAAEPSSRYFFAVIAFALFKLNTSILFVRPLVKGDYIFFCGAGRFGGHSGRMAALGFLLTDVFNTHVAKIGHYASGRISQSSGTNRLPLKYAEPSCV